MNVRDLAARQLQSTDPGQVIKANRFASRNTELANNLRKAVVLHGMLANNKKTVASKAVRSTGKSTQKITRKNYPTIIDLKTGGRSDREIARKFGVELRQIKHHISRAMQEFRSGHMKNNPGNAVLEGKKVGEEKATATQQKISAAYTPSGAAANSDISFVDTPVVIV